MAEDYTQVLGICPNCGFVYTNNPFSEERLERRYTDFSKCQYTDKDYILSESEDYIKRYLRQKHFIDSCVPVANKPITSFDENDLLQGNIDTVIIPTYTAQKAIGAILAKYESKCKIVKLYSIE